MLQELVLLHLRVKKERIAAREKDLYSLRNHFVKYEQVKNSPAQIRTEVTGSKGQYSMLMCCAQGDVVPTLSLA